MATTSTTRQAECAGSCGGRCGAELVTVKRSTDRRTGRLVDTYQPCTVLLGQGWTGHADVRWVEDEPVVVGYRHRGGLVVIG